MKPENRDTIYLGVIDDNIYSAHQFFVVDGKALDWFKRQRPNGAKLYRVEIHQVTQMDLLVREPELVEKGRND